MCRWILESVVPFGKAERLGRVLRGLLGMEPGICYICYVRC